MKVLILAVLCLGIHAEEKSDPVPIKPKEIEKWESTSPESSQLSADEIEYVHNQFKTAVIEAAKFQCVQVKTDPTNKFYTSIEHNKDNPVVQLYFQKIQNSDDLEKELYEKLYKDADLKNKGFRQWNYDGEVAFFGQKILDKVQKDEVFFKELVVIVKKILKGK